MTVTEPDLKESIVLTVGTASMYFKSYEGKNFSQENQFSTKFFLLLW